LWKNALSGNVEKSSKKFIDPDPQADEFQNLTCFLVQRYTSGKIFTKIRVKSMQMLGKTISLAEVKMTELFIFKLMLTECFIIETYNELCQTVVSAFI